MPEMDLAKLEARIYDLKQDINDTVVASCKLSIDSCYPIDISTLKRDDILLSKMVVTATDINVSVNRHLSLVRQEMNLYESYKKLLHEYTLVKDE